MVNYFAFLLTRERVKANSGALKLITVKMRWAPIESHQHNEDEDDDMDDNHS